MRMVMFITMVTCTRQPHQNGNFWFWIQNTRTIVSFLTGHTFSPLLLNLKVVHGAVYWSFLRLVSLVKGGGLIGQGGGGHWSRGRSHWSREMSCWSRGEVSLVKRRGLIGQGKRSYWSREEVSLVKGRDLIGQGGGGVIWSLKCFSIQSLVPELKRYVNWNRGVPMASRRGQILLVVFLLIRVLRHAASPLFSTQTLCFVPIWLPYQSWNISCLDTENEGCNLHRWRELSKVALD